MYNYVVHTLYYSLPGMCGKVLEDSVVPLIEPEMQLAGYARSLVKPSFLLASKQHNVYKDEYCHGSRG